MYSLYTSEYSGGVFMNALNTRTEHFGVFSLGTRPASGGGVRVAIQPMEASSARLALEDCMSVKGDATSIHSAEVK